MSNETETKPTLKLVTLSMGAITHLNNLFSGQKWTTVAKEKYAAGKLQVKLEEYVYTSPDPVMLSPREPGYVLAQQDFHRAEREWRNKTAVLELSSVAYQACVSAVKHFVNQEGGSDRYLAELQEAFLVTE